jgi:hypothetical protein
MQQDGGGVAGVEGAATAEGGDPDGPGPDGAAPEAKEAYGATAIVEW